MPCKSISNLQKKIIAIDGPAGSGKSTVARLVAKRLKFLYIDTGAMYRAVTLKTIKEKINPKNKNKIIACAKRARIGLRNNAQGKLKISLDGKDVSKQIRKPAITKIVSEIAKIPEVRKVMLRLQRKVGRDNHAVLEGRDIGTVVFPHADKKFYLDASFKERAKRRYKELVGMGQKISLGAVAEDLKNRDTIDSTRKVAPLKKAKDAVYIDTTEMSIQEVVDKILKLIDG